MSATLEVRPADRGNRRATMLSVFLLMLADNTQTSDCWSMRFADQRTDQIPLLIRSKWRHRQDDDHQNTNEEGKQVIFPKFLSQSSARSVRGQNSPNGFGVSIHTTGLPYLNMELRENSWIDGVIVFMKTAENLSHIVSLTCH